MTTVPRNLVDEERGSFHVGVRPKDAATLIIVDRSRGKEKVLLGRRHARHVFMPGKFVFPGGRVDDGDREIPLAAPLNGAVARKLMVDSDQPAETFGLAAIRETFEETGLVIGKKAAAAAEGVSAKEDAWAKFLQSGFSPDLSALHFVGRAITPPGFARRFDARFLAVDYAAVEHQVEGIVHGDAELIELIWLPIADARELDLPLITGYMLDELQDRIDAGFDPSSPVAFYATRHGEFTRELI